MSELGDAVVQSARSLVGRRFRHHFKPNNICVGGAITTDECMRRGMDDEGYDCSGLAIVSICSALGLDVNSWPRSLRHAKQLITLAACQDAEPGDIRMYTSANERIHLGIVVNDTEVIHASGVTGLVEEGIAADKYGSFIDVRVITLESVCRLLSTEKR